MLWSNSYHIQVFGMLTTIIITLIITKIFKAKKTSIFDLIKGENGAYSLSSLQAALWAFFIVSFQISILYCFIWGNEKHIFWSEYQLVLSEQVLFLLAFSLGSYLLSNKITIDQVAENKQEYKPLVKGQLSDMITSNGSLDISRLQMLIWTIVALTVFIAQSHLFLYNLFDKTLIVNQALINITQEDLKKFNSNKDEYISGMETDLKRNQVRQLFWASERRKEYNSEKEKENKVSDKINEEEDIPTVAWSFIILMGLSQGAYLYKKLIPYSKISDEKQKKLDGLKKDKIKIEGEISLLDEKIKRESNADVKIHIDTDKKLKEKQKEDISKEIQKIEEELKLSNQT